MKSLFKFILFFSMATSVSWSRDVILLENLSSHENGLQVISVLKNKFGIPGKLIVYKKKLKCTENSDAIMQLCVRPDGEMDIVKMNRFVVEETLGAFREMETI